MKRFLLVSLMSCMFIGQLVFAAANQLENKERRVVLYQPPVTLNRHDDEVLEIDLTNNQGPIGVPQQQDAAQPNNQGPTGAPQQDAAQPNYQQINSQKASNDAEIIGRLVLGAELSTDNILQNYLDGIVPIANPYLRGIAKGILCPIIWTLVTTACGGAAYFCNKEYESQTQRAINLARIGEYDYADEARDAAGKCQWYTWGAILAALTSTYGTLSQLWGPTIRTMCEFSRDGTFNLLLQTPGAAEHYGNYRAHMVEEEKEYRKELWGKLIGNSCFLTGAGAAAYYLYNKYSQK